MPDAADLLKIACSETAALLPKVAALGPELAAACDLLASCWDNGGKVLVCGNGGSCADAMHLAEELVARFQKDRRALAAIALADSTVLTCAANDFGFDHVFSRQVEALGRPGDVLVVMTTSGNSPNVLHAIAAGRERGMKVVGFLGKTGGKAKGQCDVELIVPAETAHRVQEGHKLLFHTLCEWADIYAGAGANRVVANAIHMSKTPTTLTVAA